jgi:hypothetical protein
VAVVATLRPGSRERAAEIIAGGAPYGLRLAGFEQHSVFLADEAVVFVFEGPDIEGLVGDLSTTEPVRLDSPSGRLFRELRCSHERSSIGTPASPSELLRAVAARLLGRTP